MLALSRPRLGEGEFLGGAARRLSSTGLRNGCCVPPTGRAQASEAWLASDCRGRQMRCIPNDCSITSIGEKSTEEKPIVEAVRKPIGRGSREKRVFKDTQSSEVLGRCQSDVIAWSRMRAGLVAASSPARSLVLRSSRPRIHNMPRRFRPGKITASIRATGTLATT
jgi:hypothetical protein